MANDLTSIDGTHKYLLESAKQFTPSNIVQLYGGTANFAYRVFLKTPYVTEDDRLVTSVVLKHAESYLATNRDFLYFAERQDIEARALREVARLVSFEFTTFVPEIYHEDPINRVLIMTDAGPDSSTLKFLFQTNPPSLDTCHQIGASLGTFLAGLHVASAKENSIKEFFERNTEGRRIAVFVSYGSLLNTLDQETGQFDPPIVLTGIQQNKIMTLAKIMKERIMINSDTLVMGDFWPGNILVTLSPALHCTVIDWEMARPGIPGLDIGQFLAEMITLRCFHPVAGTSVDAVVSSFLNAYRDTCMENNISKDQLVDTAWDIATRCGTHMVVTTPHAAWGSKEQTREVAKDGLNYIFNAIDKNMDWLESSVIRHILV